MPGPSNNHRQKSPHGHSHRDRHGAVSPTSSQSGNAVAMAMDSMMTSSSMSSTDSYFHESEVSSTTSVASAKTVKSFYEERYVRTPTLSDCRLQLVGTVLHAEWTTFDGIVKSSSIDLDDHIGNIDGELRWGSKHFSKSCINWSLSGTIFIASCKHRGDSDDKSGYCDDEIDLSKCINITHGVLRAAVHADLSAFMSEASWMKFKIVAEPDMDVFFQHPAFRSSVTGVAERAVAHVMEKTQLVVQACIAEAMEVVRESAREFITREMEAIIHTSYISRASSEVGGLRILREGDQRRHVHRHYRRQGDRLSSEQEVTYKEATAVGVHA